MANKRENLIPHWNDTDYFVPSQTYSAKTEFSVERGNSPAIWGIGGQSHWKIPTSLLLYSWKVLIASYQDRNETDGLSSQ